MSSNLPTIDNYGQYSSNNCGVHTRLLRNANIDLYYSYDTIVAYRDSIDGLVVSKNNWGTTTGKHLNWIDGGNKKNRKGHEVFENMLAAACNRHGI